MSQPLFFRPKLVFPASALAVAALVYSASAQVQRADQQDPAVVGYSDTPVLPGQKWRVHDPARPHPRVVSPGASPGAAPSDAVILFDGKDLSNWEERRDLNSPPKAPTWKVENGYFEEVPGTGSLFSKAKFGDCQLHVEWAAPVEIRGAGQNRGNSGVLVMGRYEIQVLDSWNSPTYADGQAGAIYGQWPPLVNAARRPGEWQTYDIVFEAPRFEGERLVKPAYFTVFHNGIVLHNHKEVMGPMVHRKLPAYAPHGLAEPLMLQQHGTRVRYRNIWYRPLQGYDLQP